MWAAPRDNRYYSLIVFVVPPLTTRSCLCVCVRLTTIQTPARSTALKSFFCFFIFFGELGASSGFGKGRGGRKKEATARLIVVGVYGNYILNSMASDNIFKILL